MSRLMLTVSVACLSLGVTHAQAQSQFVPYYTFLDNTRSAAASDYVGKPGNKVTSAAEFERMRQHILTMYGDAHVSQSFVLEGHNWAITHPHVMGSDFAMSGLLKPGC